MRASSARDIVVTLRTRYHRPADRRRPRGPAGGERELQMAFTEQQMLRYARHIVLPEIGGIGQARLLEAKVLLIGAGGLGSPLLLYLAAAGVGTLGVVDDDRVELANLQRQIAHPTTRIGIAKTDSAAETARRPQPGDRVRSATPSGSAPTTPPADRGLRPGRRRQRQLRHPRGRPRRLPAPRQAPGQRRGAGPRGPAHDLQGAPRPAASLLPLPVPDGAAAGPDPDPAPRAACSARPRACSAACRRSRWSRRSSASATACRARCVLYDALEHRAAPGALRPPRRLPAVRRRRRSRPG